MTSSKAHVSIDSSEFYFGSSYFILLRRTTEVGILAEPAQTIEPQDSTKEQEASYDHTLET